MKKFSYGLVFSPYSIAVWAKNRKDAWKKIKKAWPEYDVKKVATLY